MIKKLNLKNQRIFSHHRSGWSYAISSLQDLHINNGIRFLGFLDLDLLAGPVLEPFIGIIHNPLFLPVGCGSKYLNNPGLYNTFLSKNWLDSVSYCLGLYSLSHDLAKKATDFVSCPVESLYHPIEVCGTAFNCDLFKRSGRVLHLGQWMRRFDSFDRLSLVRKKVLLKIDNENLLNHNGILKLDWVSHSKLDEILSYSVVFNHFFDVSACNAVLDCIIRSTPIVTNRLPANEEYLGKDYPLFFDSLAEAESILNDDNRILIGHEYLKNMNKSHLTGEHFRNSIYNGKIYKELNLSTSWSLKPAIRLI